MTCRKLQHSSHDVLRDLVADNRNSKSAANKRALNPSELPLTQIDKAVLEQAGRKITTRKGGVSSNTDLVPGLAVAILQTALSGNSNAQRHFMGMLERAEEKIHFENASEAVYWSEYRAAKVKEINLARESGEPEPDCLPHPDDIHIYSDNTVEFDGPMNLEQARAHAQTQKVRDILLMPDEYEQRKGVLEPDNDGNPPEPGSFLLAILLNDNLPSRLKMSDLQIYKRQAELHRLTKRELQKHLYREWRSCGVVVRRGLTIPTLDVMKSKLEMLASLIKLINTGELDIKGKKVNQIAREIEPFIPERSF